MDSNSITIRDVAARAGVSPGTASRALRGHPQISETCIARVREAADALAYRPLRDRSGRRHKEPLAGKKIAVVLLGIDRSLASLPAVAEAIHGAEEALAEVGAHPMLINVPDPSEPPRSLRRVLFDGILAKAALQGAVVDALGSKLRSVLESNALVWMLGRPFGAKGDAVGPDNPAMGRLAAETLVAAGHTALAIVNPKADHEMFAKRDKAFAEAAGEAGATVAVYAGRHNPLREFPLEPIMEVADVQPLVDALLRDRPRPTAVFCPADSIAALVYRALATRGVQPGGDVSIISCNNERALLAGLWPPLATIDAHPRRIGHLAVRQLTRRITGEFDDAAVEINVTPTLIPGASLVPRSPSPPGRQPTRPSARS
jgi:LacI family transcriptional regulator